MSSTTCDEITSEKDVFYLLLSSNTVEWKNACSEVYSLLKLDFGIESEFNRIDHGVKGLSLLQLSKKHYEEVIEIIKNQIIDDRLQYCKKIVPVEMLVPSSEERIASEAIRLFRLKTSVSECWRVEINKRHTRLDRRKLIERIASTLITTYSKVNLEAPDRVIRIEIIGKITGVSVLKPDEIYSVKDIS